GLTAERFVPDAFGGRPGARLYRTGDRVRRKEVRECESAEVRKWNGDEACEASDGSTLALSHSRTFALEFLGRMDFQVKLRGFRIELPEIEAALAEQPGVRAAVAAVREEAAGDARLVAYVVAEGEPPSTDALRAALAARLPDYMVPGAFVVLDALPLTPNGKVDRRALPDPAAAAPARTALRVPPRTPAEREVAAVWREVLGKEEVSVDDNFFNLGGHSLLLAQVAARLEERRGREIPLLDLFRHTTVAAQAAYLDGDGRDDAPAAAPRGGGQASSRLAARPVRPGR
ncbi:MAG TPA: phosphopantetheine-binding protein, partial [Longimicrobium sp.]|nr:phosphopantetheine-binding protein [Longimicrobium sp.]